MLLQTLRGVLESHDHFVVPTELPGTHRGHKSHSNLVRVFNARRHGRTTAADMAESTRTLRVFTDAARAAHRAGSSLLLSAEGLGAFHRDEAAALMSMLGGLGFHKTRMLMVYRRLYQRLPSLHGTIFTTSRRDPLTSDYMPMVEWLAANGTGAARGHFKECARIRDMYSSLGAEVSVLNLHRVPKDSSLEREFICKHLKAVAACERLMTRASQTLGHRRGGRSKNRNRIYDLVYHGAKARGIKAPNARMAAAALEQRIAASQAAGLGHALDAESLPLLCPRAPSVMAILDATVEEEMSIVTSQGGTWGPTDDQAVREGLSDSFRLLCSTDVGAALRQPGWAKALAATLDVA
jgi:hypothetical protein